MTVPETNGPGEPPRELSVSTAPPAAPCRWWSAVPHHLGRARTSTVVLALLFVGLYTLYLFVRPPDPVAGTAPTTGSTVQTPAPSAPPVLPTETAEPTTTAPTTTPTSTPTPTTSAGTTAEETPTGTGEESPTGTAEPTPTTAEDEPTPAPTTAVPTATGAPGT